MRARKTVPAALYDAAVQDRNAYQEAFFLLRKGDKSVVLTSGERSIELLGAYRASGGLVIDEGSVSYASVWMERVRAAGDAYLGDLCFQIVREQERVLGVGKPAADPPGAICPRCLGVEPGTPSPAQHAGPFTRDLCGPCEAVNVAALRAEGRL